MDVYLLPAVVGGGLGDIDEVLTVGRVLARAGFGITLYRGRDRPLPSGVDGRWAWPPHRRTCSPLVRAPFALTVAPAWGITAAPARAERLGGAGPWTYEAGEIERAYGADRTAHLSLEEFARTLTPRRETIERFREGGVRARDLRTRAAAAGAAGEVEAFRAAYRRFRAFDRPNVLHLFASFRYDRSFAHEFPEAVQTGPLWPGRFSPRRSVVKGSSAWVWYASPASAEAIAPEVLRGLRRSRASPSLYVQTPRAWRRAGSGVGIEVRTEALPAARWDRSFRRAAVRIVTGSRSLLEALELRGPFLYFNGVLGRGARLRRHRPEKVVQLLELATRAGWPADVVTDVADFSRGRRVADVVARAADAQGGWRRPRAQVGPHGFAPGFEAAGAVVVRFAQGLAEGAGSVASVVERFRRRSHP